MRRARETLKAADWLAREGFTNDAASRAYYAAFYAASALHVQAGRDFSKHSGVRSSLHRDVIKSGLLEERFGKHYNFLWNLRNLGDYGRTERVASDKATEAVNKAREFVEAVAALLPA